MGEKEGEKWIDKESDRERRKARGGTEERVGEGERKRQRVRGTERESERECKRERKRMVLKEMPGERWIKIGSERGQRERNGEGER